MTCIIVARDKPNNIVYMGADSRITTTNPNDGYHDSLFPKISLKNGWMFGFAGNRGIQNLCDILFPIIELNSLPYEEVIQQFANIISLFGSNERGAEVIITNGIDKISWVSTNGNRIINVLNTDMYAIGTDDAAAAYGAWNALTEINIRVKIYKALEATSVSYPKFVGGRFDIFPNE